VFINGIPLAVLELKNITDANATIRGAFNQLQTYKAQIPALFNSNALLVFSDGPPDKQEKATQTVLEQAKLLCAEWAE
jgi:type I site-specific restriction-modification system R (restriction) subunit